jgi:hypothetical protein
MRVECVAPTLATACAALPPEGVFPGLGRPFGKLLASTFVASCAALHLGAKQ